MRLDSAKAFFSSERNFLLLLSVAYAAVFFSFFPSFYASIDEHEYLKNALLLRDGTIYEQNELNACHSKPTPNGFLSNQYLGKSVFLAPFTFFGMGAVMASGLFIHLINFLLFYLVLKRLNVDYRFSSLYLFFPAFLWSSRTLYPELLVLAFLLGACFLWLGSRKRDWAVAGALMGFAGWVRYDTVWFSIAFFAFLCWKEREKIVPFLSGLVPIGFSILLFNQLVYGGWLSTGYGSVSSQLDTFAPWNVLFPQWLNNVLLFSAILLIAYPLLLFALFRGGHALKWPILFSVALSVAFFSIFTDLSAYNLLSPTTFTARLRNLIPAIGLGLVSYSVGLNSFMVRRRLPLSKILWAAVVLLFSLSVFASSVHDSFIDSRQRVLDSIYAHTPEGAVIIGSSDDCMYFLKGLLPPRGYVRVDDAFIDEQRYLSSNAYALVLGYRRSGDESALRQSLVESERKHIVALLNGAPQYWELVLDENVPHWVRLYRYAGG